MSGFEALDRQQLGDALRAQGLDGWLVFDFHGINPIASRLLSPRGMVTRRVFLWLPAVGEPQLLVHVIDRPAFADFPGAVETFMTWQDLHRALQALVQGRRVAMEVFPDNAVPYLDLVPSGVVHLLERMGACLLYTSDAADE